MIGATIGNYRILGKLGEGGMGTVYKGLDLSLEREVAIKMLRSDLTENQMLIDRFRAEAIALARLNHPHIAILFNFFRHADNFFMVLEYVRGWTLSEFMKEHGPMDHTEALTLADQMLDGLSHAHHLNIVHRDLKPSNLMMTEAGVIKITDFGIARMLGTSRMTRTGGVVGTLEYMSPERIRGQEADVRSDLYSVGIVLYEMLTGHAPFRGHSSDYEIMRAQVESPPTPPRAWIPSLPEGVERVILHALAKAPEQRYQTAHEMRVALRKVGGTIPLQRVNIPPMRLSRPDAPREPGLKTTPVSATTPLPALEAPRATPPHETLATQVEPPPIHPPVQSQAPVNWEAHAEAEPPPSAKRRVTEVIPHPDALPSQLEAAAKTTAITPPEEIKVLTTAVFPPPDVETEVEARITETAPPPEEELQLPPEQAATEPAQMASEATVEAVPEESSGPSREHLVVDFTPATSWKDSTASRLTWKHYLGAAAGLALLLVIIFAIVRSRSGSQQTVAPTPSPEVAGASAETTPTPESAVSPTPEQPSAPVTAEATPAVPDKSDAGKGASKSGKDAAARERERRRQEILKTLQQKDNE